MNFISFFFFSDEEPLYDHFSVAYPFNLKCRV